MTAVGSGRSTSGTGTPPAPRERHALRDPLMSAVRLVLVLGALAVVYSQAPWNRPLDASALVELVTWLGVLAATVAWQIRGVVRSRRPWLRAVEAAILSVALLLVPFASAYVTFSYGDPASFTQPLTKLDAIYFTVTVFSTVGFGDVAPVSEPARLLVTVQMLADLALVGVIAKLLIGAAQWRRGSLSAGAGSTRPEAAGARPAFIRHTTPPVSDSRPRPDEAGAGHERPGDEE
jgi:voltage-gated potassium channel